MLQTARSHSLELISIATLSWGPLQPELPYPVGAHQLQKLEEEIDLGNPASSEKTYMTLV